MLIIQNLKNKLQHNANITATQEKKYNEFTQAHDILTTKYDEAMLIIQNLKNKLQHTKIDEINCKGLLSEIKSEEEKLETEIEIEYIFLMLEKTGMRIIDKTYKSGENQIFTANRNGRGSINSQNWYIAPQNYPFVNDAYKGVLLYNLNNLTEQPSQLNSDQAAKECFFVNEYAAYCCGFGGKIIKYEFNPNMNLKNPPTTIATTGTHIRSCMKTKEGIFIAGDSLGRSFFFDNSGSRITTLRVSATDIDQIAEVLDGIIITIEQDIGFSVHNIRNIQQPNNPITTKNYRDYNFYITGISLQLGTNGGYFALGGGKEYSGGLGFIKIGQINSDLSITIHKTKENMGFINCQFYAIREVEPGLIFIGGTKGCSIRCAWKYLEEDQPICYSIDIVDFITDFVRIRA